MLGWRICEGCKKELPEEFYRGDSPHCRTCAQKPEQRNPVVKVAPGVVAAPMEPWAFDLLKRIGAL
jgi:hypothetical protein